MELNRYGDRGNASHRADVPIVQPSLMLQFEKRGSDRCRLRSHIPFRDLAIRQCAPEINQTQGHWFFL
ncbi:hypothetical protein D9M68_553840 [compost metagenome]